MVAGKGRAFRTDEQGRRAFSGDEHARAFENRPIVRKVTNVGELGLVAVGQQAIQTARLHQALGFHLAALEFL